MLTPEQKEKKLRFLTLDAEVQGHLHAGLRSAPLNNKRYVKWYKTKLEELQIARDFARKEWREIAPPEPSVRERYIIKANGHPDLESVQAARRICERLGIDYAKESSE